MTYETRIEYSTSIGFNILYYTCRANTRSSALRKALNHVARVWGIRETRHGDRLEASILKVTSCRTV